MPGAVARTATIALTNVTLPYALEMADQGAVQAARNNPTILTGFNVHNGRLTNKDVAESVGAVYTPIETLL
jgi:alanine dehydrogenase